MRTPAFVLLCATTLACAGAEREPDPEPRLSAEPPADTAPAGRRPLHLARLAARLPSDFPHPAHRGLECTKCHPEVAGHGAHGGVACRECHEPASPAAGAVGEADCNGCHHRRTESYGCLHCHERGAREPAPGMVSVRAAGAGPDEPLRALPFGHERHSGLECTACHALPGSAPAACTSCHASHHHARADCSACHSPPEAARHPRERVHNGCGGGGCHADAAVLALPLTRSVCVTCHRAQADHRPRQECGSCHGVRLRTGATEGGS